MGKKCRVCTVCFLLALQSLTGCAEMTEQQKTTATGAGIGALAGGVIGGLIGHKNPLAGAAIGAAAGAVVGGLVGWQVGEYRMEKVKDAGQSAAATNYTPQQGVVAKIEGSSAAPQELKPGDQVVLQTQYTVLAPPDKGAVKVKEVRMISFNNQELGRLEKESSLGAGTYSSQHKVTIPSDAAEGRYTVATLVEPLAVERASKDQATAAFVVARTAAASPAPAVGPPMGLPASSPQPQFVFVKANSAPIWDGGGPNARAIATVPKGGRLMVLGQAPSGNQTWYRVRLEDQREGWVASGLVSPEP